MHHKELFLTQHVVASASLPACGAFAFSRWLLAVVRFFYNVSLCGAAFAVAGVSVPKINFSLASPRNPLALGRRESGANTFSCCGETVFQVLTVA